MKPYTIFWNYGSEGWRISDFTYETADAALVEAMKNPHTEFIIVRVITFKESTHV